MALACSRPISLNLTNPNLRSEFLGSNIGFDSVPKIPLNLLSNSLIQLTQLPFSGNSSQLPISLISPVTVSPVSNPQNSNPPSSSIPLTPFFSNGVVLADLTSLKNSSFLQEKGTAIQTSIISFPFGASPSANLSTKTYRKSSTKNKTKVPFQMPPPEAFAATGRLRDDAENHSLSMARSGTANQLTEYLNRINQIDLSDNIRSRAIEIYKIATQHKTRVRKMEFHLFASIYLAHVELGISIFPRDLGVMTGVVPNDFMPALLHYPVVISNTSTIPRFVELTLQKISKQFGIVLSPEIKLELDKMVEDVIKVPEMARTAVDSTAIALVYYFLKTYGIDINQAKYVEYFHFSNMTIETAIGRVASAYNR